MARNRLSLAHEAGFLPDGGRILFIGARLSDLPQGLPAKHIQVVQTFWPDVQALRRAGHEVVLEPAGDFAAAVVCAARARDLSRDRIAQACSVVPDGPVFVDGAKTDGIESLLSAVRKTGPVNDVISKAHGKLFRLPQADFSAWAHPPSRNSEGFLTAPGVFSADGTDPGSALLSALLPRNLSGLVADLGAGWGYLAHAALTRDGIELCHLVEADHVALDCARANVTDPRARFHWADATEWEAPAPLDHILCNPPFHTSRKADPALGRAFLAAAARNLGPRGKLWLVANRHLPYEGPLSDLFGRHEQLGGDAAFKIICAERPKRPRR